MKGFGRLQSPQDLLAKLEHDLRQLEVNPWNSYSAFNLFVTAEHMLDWLHPGHRGTEGAERRTTERERSLLLRIVSNIANGAKHFEVNRRWHDSVVHVDESHVPYGEGVYGEGPYGAQLFVTLDGEAAELFGERVDALALARKVVGYWRDRVS